MLAARIDGTAPYNWVGSAATLEENVAATIIHRLEGSGLRRTELRSLARFICLGLRGVSRSEPRDAALVQLGRSVFERPEVGCASCHPPDQDFTDGARHDVGTLSFSEVRDWSRAHHLPLPPIPLPAPIDAALRGPVTAAPGTLSLRVREAPVLGEFDTPSLKRVGFTAPYFHDGSMPTLHDLVELNADRMGTTSQLTERERIALVAYLESL
jgi:cytochrome c peroxidase